MPEGAGTDIPLDEYKRPDQKGRRMASSTSTARPRSNPPRPRRYAIAGCPSSTSGPSSTTPIGHVPGSVNLSLVFGLSKEALAKVAGPDEEIAFYCHTSTATIPPTRRPRRCFGVTTKVYRFAGGFPAWKNAGYPVEVGETQ